MKKTQIWYFASDHTRFKKKNVSFGIKNIGNQMIFLTNGFIAVGFQEHAKIILMVNFYAKNR